MEGRVLDTIKIHDLIEEEDNVVIGVSGGPDSMFLFSILYKLKEVLNFNIIVCHINHGVRGIESDEDEKFVKDECKNLNIPYHFIRVNMDEYANENNLTSEEAGRELRYRFFRKTLSDYGKGVIAVAHNKNDQGETLLMRFFRGTGIDGLKGMDYKSNDVIRPILDISRNEIEEYILCNNIPVRIDKTNKMDIYRRNSIRLNLIPMIEENYNPSIIDTLFRTSRIIERDFDFINVYTKDVFKRVVMRIDANKIEIDINELIKEHKAIQYRIIRVAIEKIIGHLKGIEEVHIEVIINLVKNNITGKKVDISNDIEGYTEYNKLILQIKKDNKTCNFKSKLYLNRINFIPELNMKIDIQLVDKNIKNIKSKDMFIKYFDYDKIDKDLFIRNRESGDKFKPLGMNGTKKLKDFFIDEKVPRDKRDKTPLIYDEKGIIWVVGYRISEDYKIDSSTKRILKISINK
ncbi:tRNA lysidine(34) synthetase TilS [Clostridium sp. D2Q-14]|uniref:tRNA lysidine(34) synthetase TilS n=1 Tax=Anaeromonas gelatinilytica TaxID=2683194 RepID=UPI00193B269D|nr:tRNA lysidine(34) synthetase TilS [Anaeromonas gelatinilytica]MBS4534695.1 tRNA lysidine(34) synthetase TilS [Anaeromonas gelatinilytica]